MQGFCQQFGHANIATMASGGTAPTYRFYFHAQPSSGSGRFLVEMLANTSSQSVAITVKSDADPQLLPLFEAVLKSRLSSVGG